MLWVFKAFGFSLPVNTTASRKPVSANDHSCYGPGDRRVSVTMDDCRPLFNWMRTLPNYGLEQDFREGQKPRLPNRDPPTPPFTWWDEVRHCAISIIADNPFIVDRFSFKQARALATELIEDCQDEGGYGGFSVIGKNGVGWTVRAIGIELEPEPPSNGTTLLSKDRGVNNMTVIGSLELNSDAINSS